MGTFHFNDAVCEINIEDKLHYKISLHENMMFDIKELADKMIKKLGALDPNAKESFDEAYNSTLDAIDQMLGEGAGEEIMALRDEPSLFDCAAVIQFITEEYITAYKEHFGEQKKSADIPKRSGRR